MCMQYFIDDIIKIIDYIERLSEQKVEGTGYQVAIVPTGAVHSLDYQS